MASLERQRLEGCGERQEVQILLTGSVVPAKPLPLLLAAPGETKWYEEPNMRPLWLALILGLCVGPSARATDLRFFEDAPLHAVQFVDAQEGWAVGDEGVVWHTIDGGKSWERQPTGVRASLRALHFFNPYVGWVVGREELPLGAGSAGVLLFTRDGGLSWKRVTMNAMPGLNFITFVDNKIGFALGDGTDLYPSGVFMTRDSGRSWRPVPGERAPGWFAGAFTDEDSGALVGAWNRLANLRKGSVVQANVDTLGGRNVRGLYLGRQLDGAGVAVGQGGLLLLTKNRGINWNYPELKLPAEVLASLDLHTVHGAGKKIWAAGRPGSVLLHSPDGGQTWEMWRTGQPLPINGLFFRDENHGWAVGELGTILATSDGGKSWQVRQQGGRRAGVLFVHARPANFPTDAVARLGADEGWLAAGLTAFNPDFTTASPARAAEPARLALALRQAGGAAAECGWQFPLPGHLERSRDKLLELWNARHGEHAAEQLLRQLVLAIRIWRPEVLITDCPGKDVEDAAGALLAEALSEAFRQAGDPAKFPEQLQTLGLTAWKPSKLYAQQDRADGATVSIDLAAVNPRLEGTLQDFATPPASLLQGKLATLPQRRYFRLLAANLAGAETHAALMQGVTIGKAGYGRRAALPAPETSEDLARVLRARTSLQAIARHPVHGLTDADRLLAAIGPSLDQLPDQLGAPAAHAIATQFARVGQWHLAREAFLLMVERYPTSPLAADAYRWLIRHNASSETRRRHELGQFLMTRETSVNASKQEGGTSKPGPVVKVEGKAEVQTREQLIMSQSLHEVRAWHAGALKLEPRLSAFGTLFGNDPSLQFCLQAARRNLGDFEGSRRWFSDFAGHYPAGPWKDAAQAELWLVNRQGKCPKPFASCQLATRRPYLDGKFDDPCWQKLEPLVLQDAAGTTAGKHKTLAWLTHDKDFLYLALRCERVTSKPLPVAKGRKRDEDLSKNDRVSIYIDLDRDYSTCFHFQVDEQGRVREDCWGDASWNPRWFVACHSDDQAWQIEAAIPLAALTGDGPTSGRTWAFNVVRVLPNQGLQAWSLPAGLPEADPRLEGLGLLGFLVDPAHQALSPVPRMPRVP